MNANVSKTNTGKLLVAVLAMAMVVAGAVVVLSDNNEVNAEVPPPPTPSRECTTNLELPTVRVCSP